MNTIEIIPPKRPVLGTVSIGGSKSYSNRALVMAALARGKSTLTSLSTSDDSVVLIDALKQLGVIITTIDETTVEVEGNGGHFGEKSVSINVGRAGTAMRFLCGLSSLVPGTIELDGSSRMRERPMSDLIAALRSLEVGVICNGKEGFPPLTIQGNPHMMSEVSISGKVSSQFITSLLLIAPALSGGMKINIHKEQISKSYIDMTIDGMKSFGVEVSNDNYQSYTVAPLSTYKATSYRIEGDASGASYLFGVAAVTGGEVTVENINPHSAQGDIHFVDILERMGCKVTKNDKRNAITVAGPKKLKAVSVDMTLMPDTAQTLAVVAAFAEGTTHITGLSTLRVKETDRIAALMRELSNTGVVASCSADSIAVKGGRPHGSLIHTYKDHRMALAFSIMGAVVKGIQIEDPTVVSKSFPDYWEKVQVLGIQIKHI